MLKYWLYVLEDLDNSFLKNSRLYRALRGGRWYKECMSGELPNCYGCWWTREPLKSHRYHYIDSIEDYAS